MQNLLAFLQSRLKDDLLWWPDQLAAADKFEVNCAEIERVALENAILPARYQRNRQMISVEQQLQLFNSTVGVVGCGGLGGYILEELARLGIGRIVAIDPDVFEEHNLNRQLLSSPQVLGKPKVEAAHRRVAEINPAVTLEPVQVEFSTTNSQQLLGKVDVAVDAVDNVPARLELAEACDSLGIPLVHGAIAGWYGHVATQFPGDNTVQKIYSRWVKGKGVEQHLGNPSFTPAVAASFEVAEVCKVILGQGEPLRNRKLSINLLDMDVEEIPL